MRHGKFLCAVGLAFLTGGSARAVSWGRIDRPGFSVSEATLAVDNEARGRSGHMGHALVDCGRGRILAFNSNVSTNRCLGHSGYGWMEYRVSTDYGRTWGKPRVLDYSMKLYREGRHTALCEKGVRAPDGRIILFFQITDASRPICCEPWSEPTYVESRDGGETWSAARVACSDKGRIYDAVVDRDSVYFLMPTSPRFCATNQDYVVYKSTNGGPFVRHVTSIEGAKKGYGAMEFAKDGSLVVYAYDSLDEDHPQYAISHDCALTWETPGRIRCAKFIRNPQVRRVGDDWFLCGRNGGRSWSDPGRGDGLVLYHSKDGFNWDEGVKIDQRPDGTGTGYYSCLLPVFEPGRAPRLLMQYSHPYWSQCVNVRHRWIEIRPRTVCNPVDLGYRCALKGTPSYREGADPSVVRAGDRFWLFTSKCGGGYWSDDLAQWTFVPMPALPTEAYAPDVSRLGNRIFHIANGQKEVREAVDLATGTWRVCGELPGARNDGHFFFDTDGRLYFYWGCSPLGPIWGQELDPATFAAKGKAKALYRGDPSKHPWEVVGDANDVTNRNPYIEGAYLVKNDGRYYLHVSAPGTEFKSYCDAVLVGMSPLGPFALQKRNPVFRKAWGFATGGGHGCTFQDAFENWWHLGTMSVSANRIFERRIVLYPVLFDAAGEMVTSPELADGPMILPQKKATSFADYAPGWMPLATNRTQLTMTASSVADGEHGPEKAFDEDVRTWWTAKSGEKDEWLSVDLGRTAELAAVQVNLADDRATQHGYDPAKRFAYRVEGSTDGKTWEVLVDESNPAVPDRVHAYFPLPMPVRVWQVRLVNVAVPSGRFAVSGFRLWGREATAEGVPRTGKAWWSERFARNLERIRTCGGEFDIVMLGDSITHYWEVGEGLDDSRDIEILEKKWKILNCGYGGDRIENLLWRVKNGELDGYKAKVVTLMIGTNNAGDRPEDIVRGVRNLVDEIYRKQPQSKILLMGYLPIGEKRDDGRRARLDAVRPVLKTFANSPTVRWFDCSEKFLNPDGTTNKALFDYEYIHPSTEGYRVFREALEPVLDELLDARPESLTRI